MSLIIMALAHSTYDGQCISFPLMYYVDSLLMMTRLIRWSTILLRQFCFALDCCRVIVDGRVTFPFTLELFIFF